MKKLIIFVILSLGLSALASPVLLITDVDDTIKLAHVKDLKNAAFFAFDESSHFMGMSELYNALVNDIPELKVVYLSRAPEWLMRNRHLRFLKNTQFPAGQYIGQSQYPSATHKLRHIRQQIALNQPKTVILVGDNGEQDFEIYSQIAQEYEAQGIRFLQFIRIAYDTPAQLYFDQIGFVTPVEMALELEKERLLRSSALKNLMEFLIPKILNEKLRPFYGEAAFPYFVKCRNFKWLWENESARYPELRVLSYHIAHRCR